MSQKRLVPIEPKRVVDVQSLEPLVDRSGAPLIVTGKKIQIRTVNSMFNGWVDGRVEELHCSDGRRVESVPGAGDQIDLVDESFGGRMRAALVN
jgi:hypothetical protein